VQIDLAQSAFGMFLLRRIENNISSATIGQAVLEIT
jgi:hypothetical protein